MAAGFPLLLPYNLVSIYGLGSTVGQRSDSVPLANSFQFGTIYHVGAGMNDVIIGNSILYDSENDVVCQLAWDTVPYTIVRYNNIVGTEYLS